jgi:hypothetical protein
LKHLLQAYRAASRLVNEDIKVHSRSSKESSREKKKSPSPKGWTKDWTISVKSAPKEGTMTYERYLLYQKNDGSAIDSVVGETVSVTTKGGVEKQSTITRTHINTDIGNGLLELKPSSTKKQKKKSPSKEKTKKEKKGKKEKKEKEEKEEKEAFDAIKQKTLNSLLNEGDQVENESESESESESENESDDE